MPVFIGLDFGTSFVRLAAPGQGKPSALCQPIPVWMGAGFLESPGADLQLKQKLHDAAPLVLYGQSFSRADLAVRLFSTCRRQAESALGTGVDGCVVTVHSQAGSIQREMLRQALTCAGFNQVRLLNTPTAAALSSYDAARGEQKVLVFCLGAGMLDVNLAVCTPASYTVLASGGLEHVSGKQFTARLSGYLLQQFQEQHQVDLSKNAAALALIWDEAERAKEQLSIQEEVAVAIPRLCPDGADGWLDFNTVVARAQFEEQIDSYLLDSLNLCQRYLTDLHLSPADLDEIWLEGGCARIPALQQTLAGWWGKAPGVLPENAAALGAALYTQALAQPPAARAAPAASPATQSPAAPSEAETVKQLWLESDRRLQQGDYEGAVQQLTQAGMLLQQQRARVYYRQGIDQEGKNDLSSARSLYLVASRMDRSNPDYRLAIERLNRQEARIAHDQGRELERAQEYKPALEAYHLAIRLDPENYGYRASRARLALRMLLPRRFEAFVNSRVINRDRLNSIFRQLETLHHEAPGDRYLDVYLKSFRLVLAALDTLQAKDAESNGRAKKSSQERRAEQDERRARAEALLHEALKLTPEDAFVKKLLVDYLRK